LKIAAAWRIITAMSLKPLLRGAFLICVVAAGVSGCGYAQWPPPGSVPADVNRPSSTGATAFTNASAVIVGRGDTVYGLARRHRISARIIIQANKLRPPYLLRIGQRLMLPRQREHVVVSGDSLYAIAKRYGVGAYDVARLNNLSAPYVIRIGQRLTLPAPSTVKTVAVSPNAGGSKTRPSMANATKVPVKSAPAATAAVVPAAPAPFVVPKPPPSSGEGFLWPVRGKVVSGFGAKSKGLRNDGINIAAARGSPVRAVENGVVAYAGNELRGFGNLLLIKHSDGWVSAYAHNEKLLVRRGDKIKKGQNISTVGSTGNVKTPQLHFELRKGKTARDPRKYLHPA
jgi:murein DD-endopeptidase MepM/ murein hydrolase activator NlpD